MKGFPCIFAPDWEGCCQLKGFNIEHRITNIEL